MLSFNAKLAYANIHHRRLSPKAHDFSYRIAYLWLNLDQINEITKLSPFWSIKRFNLISLNPQDYINRASKPNQDFNDVKESVLLTIKEQYSDADIKDSSTQVMMLTLPRFLGYLMNPVTFYYVFDKKLSTYQPSYIVSEITNTPWGERHTYIHAYTPTHTKHTFEFNKEFHVSPFMPMSLQYDWQFSNENTQDEEKLNIHMNLIKKGAPVFNATMQVSLQALTTSVINAYPMRYPMQTLKVAWGIYWQALKIRLKGNPFYTHPKKNNFNSHTTNDVKK